MSIFDASQLMFNNPSFYNDVVKQSARFDGNAGLNITHSSAPTLQTKGTVAVWIKLHDNNDRNYLIQTGGTNNNNTMDIRFGGSTSNQGMHIGQYGKTPYTASTTGPKQRDFNAWYHLLVSFDSTSSTASERQIKIFINGVQVTTGTFGAISQNEHFPFTIQSQAIYIGRHTPGYNYWISAYLADFHIIDGQALTPDNFTEIKKGICIPKAYEGTYGNNGFRLEFKETGSGQDANGIGADTSGNNNHFAVYQNLGTHDSNMPDSPENNFCTLNEIGYRYGHGNIPNFFEGNLKTSSGGNASAGFGTMAINQVASQGGVYFEVRLDSIDGNRTYGGVVGDSGINNKNSNSNGASYSFPIKGLIGLMASPRGYFNTATDASGSLDTTSNSNFGNGDVVGFAILSDGKFFCHRNGTYMTNADGNTGNPSTGANPIATIDLTEGDWLPYVGYNSTFSVNFGQDGTFSGQETSGGHSDANGIGDFMFAVPTNCLALCSSNMAEPDISPNASTQADNNFNTVLFNGTGSSPLSVTGVGFKPDFLWLKRINGGTNGHNILYDSSRGGTNALRSSTAGAEAQFGDMVITYESDGFSFTGTDGLNNSNSYSNVAWSWKANGGTTSSNGNGSITSTVQANTKAGFSIVLYTGTGANATIGHGLGVTPSMVIYKIRDVGTSWAVWHKEFDTPTTQLLELNGTGSTLSSASYWNSTLPNSTVLSVGTYGGVNTNGSAHLAYCFADIDGYSKFGSYIGFGGSDGGYIYTGFRPTFLLIKRKDSANYWLILDNKRDTLNPNTRGLYANLSDAENTFGNGTGIDFLSNGFKLRDSVASVNSQGGEYIYMAFAEAPFKYANAG